MWSTWTTTIQAFLNADQTQVGQDSAAAQSQAESAFRVAEALVNAASAIAHANQTLQFLQAQPLSYFTSSYSQPNNGPGTNPGTTNDTDVWTQIVTTMDWATNGAFTTIILSPQFGAALNGADQFFAGMSDALTVGLSTRARAAIYGQTATQNHQGTLFQAGQITGGVLGAAIAFGSPCTLSTVGAAGYRLLNGIQVVGGVINASENIVNGHPWMAALDAAGVLGNLATFLKACFEAGTPIRQRYGSKPIEQLQAGDWVLARSEFDPEGPVEEKQVEEVFVAEAQIWEVHVGGQVIRTTSEHPFWVWGKGWTPAQELMEGDELSGEISQRFVVARVRATEDVVRVYNVRVAEYHTYFVGNEDWGFSVWAHNANCWTNFLSGTAGNFKTTASQTWIQQASQVYRALMAAPGRLAKPLGIINSKLQNIANDLYRAGAKIGYGSTADGLRAEKLIPGFLVGGKSHAIKAQEYLKAVNNWLAKNPLAAPNDIAIANMLRTDLLNAINRIGF